MTLDTLPHTRTHTLSYGALAFLSLIEHKEWSHERPMGQVFERVLQGAAQGPEPYCRSLRFIPFDFHRSSLTFSPSIKL
jgi:hypothetical protein